MNTYTTAEAAPMVGMTAAGLRQHLVRHPENRPFRKHGLAWVWTEEEIERVRNRK